MTKEEIIFAVTTLTRFIGEKRTVGWFKSFEEAEEIVKHNLGDIWEEIYLYCVIEEIQSGLYPYTNEWWYQRREGGWEQTNKPSMYFDCVNFAMG